ncbi:MAG TPA: hypothetical protein VFP40_14195 [Terriglobales bacterium]|nr:hypothetical protein [Terriglobales bacterium]
MQPCFGRVGLFRFAGFFQLTNYHLQLTNLTSPLPIPALTRSTISLHLADHPIPFANLKIEGGEDAKSASPPSRFQLPDFEIAQLPSVFGIYNLCVKSFAINKSRQTFPATH